MNEENIIKKIEDDIKIEVKQEDNSNKEEIIFKLPDWSIEPPLEIKRGEK